MTLNVIIPLYGFQQQREAAFANLLQQIDAQDHRVIDSNGQVQDQKNFNVIIVEQTQNGKHHRIPDRQYISHITLPDHPKGFNKSWCMNVGARQANNERLVFLDVDMMFCKSFFSKIASYMIQPEMRYFTCWSYIVSFPGKDVPITRVISKDIMTAGGAFYIDRTLFWYIGGMNENYFGYGGEDNDLWVRVNSQLGERGQINIPALSYALGHWYHDWAAPSEERFYPLNRTIQHTNEVIARLRSAPLGNARGPTIIDISDLALSDAGIENKEGKGII